MILIVVMALATLINIIVFVVAGLPQLQSFRMENRMTCYVLKHHDEMTSYAVQFHDEKEPETVDNYLDWEARWSLEGEDGFYIVLFICQSWGIAPSTGYEGGYYTSDGKPYDFSQMGLTLDNFESKCIGYGWYWYKIIT